MVCDTKNVERVVPAIFAWALLLIATGLFFAFPCWYLTQAYSVAIPIVQSVITFFVLTNFTLATCLDPGVIPKAHSDEYGERETEPLYIDVDVKSVKIRLKWCMTCHFFRPPRCTHCGICDSCIEVFDHHCPWLNNCIGHRNYRFFFLFLVWLSIHMLSILGLCILYMRNHLSSMRDLQTVITITIIIIIIVFIIPILGLTVFHTTLILRGRTTNEQITGKFLDVSNPYSEGFCRNLSRTLCSSLLPSYSYQSRQKKGNTEPPEPIFQIESNVQSPNPTYYQQGLGSSLSSDSVYTLDKKRLAEYQSAPLSYEDSNRYHRIDHVYCDNDIPYRIPKGSRAITPPVSKHDGYRFHHFRRSLPAQGRFHPPAQHSASNPLSEIKYFDNHQYVGDLHSEKKPFNTAVYHQQTPRLTSASWESCRQTGELYAQKGNRSEYNAFAPAKRQSSYLPTCESYCLENESFRGKETIRAMTPSVQYGGSSSHKQDTIMAQCKNFCKTQSKAITICDYDEANPRSPSVDMAGLYQPMRKKSLEDLVGDDVSVHFTGRRPLSFVKAIEMSDAVESSEQKKHLSLGIYTHNIPIDGANDGDSSKREISYEICV